MGAIYLKELRSYFKSFFGWLYLAIYTLFCSLYFVIYNLVNGSPYLSGTVSSLVVIIMFVFPLLTMRVLAEEKKLKTDQLLLTSPIKVSSIVLGKFFALITMQVIASLVLLLGLLILRANGDVPVAESLLSVLALVLLGCMFAAIGLFLSSLTEHQFIAAILTYGSFIFIMLVPSALQVLFSSNKVIATIAGVIDFLSPFDKLLTGIISGVDLLKILSIIVIFLILAARVFGKSSLQVSLVGAKKFWFSALGLIALIAIIIGANVGVSFIPEKYTQYDLTKQGYYTVSKDTKALLKSLDKDVTIHVLADESTADKTLKVYLDQYQSESGHIKVKYHSTTKEANFFTAYTDTPPSGNSVIVECGDKNTVVDYDSLYVTEYNIDYSTYQYVPTQTGVDMEGQLTAAISYVTSDESHLVYILEGHGELALTQTVGERMKKAGFTTASLNLLALDAIPDDCEMLVVNGPNVDLSKDDVDKIKAYLDTGGNAVFMAASAVVNTPNYDGLLSGFGAAMVPGTVWEDDPMYNYNGMGYYLVLSPVAHEITNNVYSGKRKNLLVESCGFVIEDEEDVNISIDPLYQSSANSLAVEMDEKGNVLDEENLEQGPFVVGFYSTKQLEEGESKVMVIGSPVFLHDALDSATSYSNTEVFIGALSYMNDISLNTSIPAKMYDSTRIVVSQGVVFLYAALLIVLLPLAEIIAGIVIMIVRRRK